MTRDTNKQAVPEKPDHWSDYWSQGQLTSLPQDFQANYEGELKAFWLERFANLSPGSKMLDACTGNGAIALLAADFFRQSERDVKIVAVDAARPQPQMVAQRFPDQLALLRDVEFVGHCKVEELDVSLGPFDLISSQYGIEYCHWQPAAARLSEVLQRGGQLVMVCHSPESEMMAVMQAEKLLYEKLEAWGFFRHISHYLDERIDHQEMASALSTVLSEVKSEFRVNPTALFRSVGQMLEGLLRMNRGQVAAGRGHLKQYYAQTRFGYDRLNDMLRVNQALMAEDDWVMTFEQAGLELVNQGSIKQAGTHHAGQYFIFEKQAESGRNE